MKRDCYVTPKDNLDSPEPMDLRDQDCPAADREYIIELGHKARQEAERFINGNIDDSTKGWPVLSRKARRGTVGSGLGQ